MSESLFVDAPDGTRIAVQVAPGPQDAATIVLSHSLGCDMSMWDPQMAVLTRHFRVVRYDHRGHGRSDAPAGDYTIDLLGADALAVIDAVCAHEAVHFCGLSMGAMVGMWLATRQPQRLRSLVLANTAAHIPLRDMFVQRIHTARTEGMATIAAPTIDRWLSDAFRDRHAAQRDALVDAMLHMAPHGYAGCCAVLRDTDLRPDLGRIALPTLVIGGSADPSTTPQAMHALAHAIDGAGVLILDGASHLSNIEHPGAFAEALLAHFESQETS